MLVLWPYAPAGAKNEGESSTRTQNTGVCIGIYIQARVAKGFFCCNKLCGRLPQYATAPYKLTFDLETGVRVTCDVD